PHPRRDRLLIRQLPRRAVEIVADPEVRGDSETRLLIVDQRDAFHAIEPEHAHRVALARAPHAVPMAPREHQPVRLDDALFLGIAADRVVVAAHRSALLYRLA